MSAISWIDHARAAFGAIDSALTHLAAGKATLATECVDDAGRLLARANDGIALDVLTGDGSRIIMRDAIARVDAGRALLSTDPAQAAKRLGSAKFAVDLLLPYGPR